MSHRFEQGEQGEQGPAPTSSSSEGRATIGWVQSTTSGEIDTALACAKRHAEVLLLNDIDAAADALRQRPLRAVVLAQPRRGVWTSDDCERLRQISPLAQLIGVHGSWCEGWHRTGHVWSGVEHLYWHQVSGALPRILRLPPLPSTSDVDEKHLQQELLDEVRALPKFASMDLEVAISAPAPSYDALRDTLADVGLVAQPAKLCDDAALGIWDGDPRFAEDLQRLEALHPCCGGRLLAIALAPRLADWRQIEAWTSDIITKPFFVADLYPWIAAQMAAIH